MDIINNSQLLSKVFIMCGVKPHRVESAISKARTEFESKNQEQSLQEILAQIVADDVLKKKNKNKNKKSVNNGFEEDHQDEVEELPLLRVCRSLKLFQQQASTFCTSCSSSSSSSSLIILISGSTGSGKSTLASQLATRLGISSVLSTDSIREALRNNPSAASAVPEVGKSTFDASASYSPTSFDPAIQILSHFQKQCSAVLKVLETYLEKKVIPRGESIIVEGVHLVPSWVRIMMKRIYCNNSNNNRTRMNNTNTDDSEVIIVPIFAFVGGSTKHMNRFAWRRNRNLTTKVAKAVDAGEEKTITASTAGAVNSSSFSPPSLNPTENRYVDKFEEIRMIHHWFLSEIGKWFVHAEISDYCDGGIDFEFHDDDNNDDEGDEKNQQQQPNGSNLHNDADDDKEKEDPEELLLFSNNDSFRRESSSCCFMNANDRATSNESNNTNNNNYGSNSVPSTPTTALTLANSKTKIPSRLWYRWRKRANIVIKMIRAQYNSNNINNDTQKHEEDHENSLHDAFPKNNSTTSSLTPILDNVNLDRSVNFAHRAIQMWLDSQDLHVACEHALPETNHQQQDHQTTFGGNQSTGVLLMDKWDDVFKRQTSMNENDHTIASFLQKRRQEKLLQQQQQQQQKQSPVTKKLSTLAKGQVIVAQDRDDEDDKSPQAPPYLDYGTSSGDDCGGSLQDDKVSVGSH